MRIERVILEHHRDIALFRRHIVDDAVGDGDLAPGDALQPGDHAQQSGFAAARGPDQDDELAIRDIDADPVQDLRGARTPCARRGFRLPPSVHNLPDALFDALNR